MATSKKVAKKAAPAKKAEAPKTSRSAAKTEATVDGAQVKLPAGKGTQNDTPPPSNPDPIPRGKNERAEKDDGKDTLRLQRDKARWTYGETTPVAQLAAEQREITAASEED